VADHLTHVNDDNRPQMVDITSKTASHRLARARAEVVVNEAIRELLADGDLHTKKGPVFHTAIIAGTMAVKNTSQLIPFCHPLPIEDCQIVCSLEEDVVRIECTVATTHKTGVEMEALTGATVAALTIYDMCKAVDRHMIIRAAHVIEKCGGKHDFCIG